MQYLAKVHTKASETSTELQLLAVNIQENTWELVTPTKTITTPKVVPFHEQVLVLVELDSDNQLLTIQEGTQWVLNFISEYLTFGLTPSALKKEVARAEQWRQSLTLQSQEVRRRALETAARRDEIQALEKRLKLEQQQNEG